MVCKCFLKKKEIFYQKQVLGRTSTDLAGPPIQNLSWLYKSIF